MRALSLSSQWGFQWVVFRELVPSVQKPVLYTLVQTGLIGQTGINFSQHMGSDKNKLVCLFYREKVSQCIMMSPNLFLSSSRRRPLQKIMQPLGQIELSILSSCSKVVAKIEPDHFVFISIPTGDAKFVTKEGSRRTTSNIKQDQKFGSLRSQISSSCGGLVAFGHRLVAFGHLSGAFFGGWLIFLR